MDNIQTYAIIKDILISARTRALKVVNFSNVSRQAIHAGTDHAQKKGTGQNV